MSTKYRKKPVVIEALQWTYATQAHEIEAWALESDSSGPVVYDETRAGPADADGQDWGHLSVKTLEGTHVATPGDYLIRGVQGEFYFCKPDIFEATYEIVEEG